ncbi:hypothetical protein CPB84DRAFT_1847020 [Gymnopilus junonius]|uniref:Uncharacterized protein n=1 Tax=Gymnopilus junonius TaxID=109634 RepID=A0A9P5NQZ1_GYMJU|nr:hypothetical protein CPB84DRAFT_1847020 [Gymnopilus junonius]
MELPGSNEKQSQVEQEQIRTGPIVAEKWHLGFRYTDRTIKDHNIVGLLAGGSASYNASQTVPRDWDGLIILKDYESVLRLLSDQDALSELLGVGLCKDPMWWSRNGPLEFDAARFCGHTTSGLKKSVKIVAADRLKASLKEPNASGIKILSQKDVRLYSMTYNGGHSWRVQPVTSVSDQLFILHDADIFLSPKDNSGHQYACFGCTMDMLLTGKWIYSTQDTAKLEEYVVRKYSATQGIWIPEDWTTIFSQNTRFPISFRNNLRLRGWERLLPSPSSLPFAMLGNLFWLEDSTPVESIINHFKAKNEAAVSEATTEAVTYPNLHDREKWVSTPIISLFSSNSTALKLTSVQDPGVSVFQKRTAQWKGELAGASQLRVLGNRIHQALHFDPVEGVVYYPWFPGTTIADLRKQYFDLTSMSSEAYELFRVILEAEMRKAEDILTLYCNTTGRQPSETNIQQFFCDRILDGQRLCFLYPLGLTLGGMSYTVDQILSWSVRVNGKHYSCLATTFKEALALLSIEDITVIGLGDGHGGNVLVGEKGDSSAEALRYIDYEAAGRHSPWLDMAKPIYNDVFYSIFYADLLGRDLFADGTVQIKIQEYGVDIKFVFFPDDLTCGIWQVKKQYLLDPFVNYIQSQGFNTDNWNRKVGLALLCCALLTRNFSTRPDLFFANMALGVILAQWNGSNILEF